MGILFIALLVILIAFVIAAIAFLAPALDALIPFDVLASDVAVGFGVTAGAVILLATAVARIQSTHWGWDVFVGFGALTMLFWSDSLSTFMFTAVWTLFAGGAAADPFQKFKDIAEEDDLGPAALSAATVGLAYLSFPLAFLVPLENSFFGRSLPFLLGALLLALVGFSYWLCRRSVPLGSEPLREAYRAAAFMPLLSVFIIARRYFEASAAPLIPEWALWAALIAAYAGLIAASYRIEKRVESAEQEPSDA